MTIKKAPKSLRDMRRLIGLALFSTQGRTYLVPGLQRLSHAASGARCAWMRTIALVACPRFVFPDQEAWLELPFTQK
jgi:hypothetical protein